MNNFMDKDFLLTTETAKSLFHQVAKDLPIIDYHCHLDPREVAENHQFRSITELWLGGDHYKWRAMRTNGIDEKYITGNASDWEKFQKWAECMPYCMRNPLYHWTHLELRTAFGTNKILNPENARYIYDLCNEKLKDPAFSARELMKRYKVEVVCTTDDPTSDLAYHKQVCEDKTFSIKMLPTFRPDKALAVGNPQEYKTYLQQLSKASNVEITDFDSLIESLQQRHDYFHSIGCRLSDHGITDFPYAETSLAEVRRIFGKVMEEKVISMEEVQKLQFYILLELCRMNARKDWAQQFHYGPIRNNNTRMFKALGPDTGFDSVGDTASAYDMAHFLDALDTDNLLARTIIYCINPADNTKVAAMIGNFQDGSVAGKIQFGSGWWFNDQLYGMRDQINTLSTLGLLSRFVGMLTDSRSFLSYPRHEYFRRLLCQIVGKDVEEGLLPVEEMPFIKEMIANISYYNAKNYFKF